MTKNRIAPTVVIALAGILIASLSGVFTASPVRPEPQTSAADVQLATIKQYCAGCHNDRAKTGGVSFDGITADSIGQKGEMFEKAVRKLRGRVMPPPGSKQPDAAAIDSLVAWLESSLDKAAGQAHMPDQVVLHRLNRKEYENAVRICSQSISMRNRFCLRTISQKASTILRRHCRCRLLLSSNM